jgi:glyoxylase-like metal-dependent hydrolase (beta-lactamase superfamily II)
MAVQIPFRRELEFDYGHADRVGPRIRRVIARNPSPFTLYGTGTYILGNGQVAVVDPGPADPAHIQAILDATKGETITHVLVTHTHTDHSPGCALLKKKVAAPPTPTDPTAPASSRRACRWKRAVTWSFSRTSWCATATSSPATTGPWSASTRRATRRTTCASQLREDRALFTGDHIMGWSTSIISPPDGDMAAYMASLELLLERDDEVYWPTHGPRIEHPKELVGRSSSTAVSGKRRSCDVSPRASAIRDMVPVMYTSTPEFMFPAAARSVLAAVEYMVKKGDLVADGPVTLDGTYRLP